MDKKSEDSPRETLYGSAWRTGFKLFLKDKVHSKKDLAAFSEMSDSHTDKTLNSKTYGSFNAIMTAISYVAGMKEPPKPEEVKELLDILIFKVEEANYDESIRYLLSLDKNKRDHYTEMIKIIDELNNAYLGE